MKSPNIVQSTHYLLITSLTSIWLSPQTCTTGFAFNPSPVRNTGLQPQAKTNNETTELNVPNVSNEDALLARTPERDPKGISFGEWMDSQPKHLSTTKPESLFTVQGAGLVTPFQSNLIDSSRPYNSQSYSSKSSSSTNIYDSWEIPRSCSPPSESSSSTNIYDSWEIPRMLTYPCVPIHNDSAKIKEGVWEVPGSRNSNVLIVQENNKIIVSSSDLSWIDDLIKSKEERVTTKAKHESLSSSIQSYSSESSSSMSVYNSWKIPRSYCPPAQKESMEIQEEWEVPRTYNTISRSSNDSTSVSNWMDDMIKSKKRVSIGTKHEQSSSSYIQYPESSDEHRMDDVVKLKDDVTVKTKNILSLSSAPLSALEVTSSSSIQVPESSCCDWMGDVVKPHDKDTVETQNELPLPFKVISSSTVQIPDELSTIHLMKNDVVTSYYDVTSSSSLESNANNEKVAIDTIAVDTNEPQIKGLQEKVEVNQEAKAHLRKKSSSMKPKEFEWRLEQVDILNTKLEPDRKNGEDIEESSTKSNNKKMKARSKMNSSTPLSQFASSKSSAPKKAFVFKPNNFNGIEKKKHDKIDNENKTDSSFPLLANEIRNNNTKTLERNNRPHRGGITIDEIFELSSADVSDQIKQFFPNSSQ